MNVEIRGCKIKNTVSINEVVTISKQRFSDGYFFRGESHAFYEAVFVLSGKVGITAGKDVYVLSQGQMTLHRPGQFHAIWEEGGSGPEVIVLTFFAAPFPNINGYVYDLTPSLSEEIKGIYDRAYEVFDIEKVPNDLIQSLACSSGKMTVQDGFKIKGIKPDMEKEAFRFGKRLEIFFSEALEYLSAEVAEYSGRGSENYVRILSVIEDNIEKNLSVTELASLCKMSVPTLEKTVFRYLHSGAMAYYNILKLNKAHELLSDGRSVKETAFTLGYSNQNYFSSCFKKRFGYPPSEVKRLGS